MKKLKKFLFGSACALLLLLVIAGAFIHRKTYYANAKAQAISQKAKISKDYLFFEAVDEKASLIFYQGAFVQASAYAEIAQDLANRGIDVYLIETPLNLPVLSSQEALKVIETKKLTSVYLAGHSLGGVIASMNAAKSDNVTGLVLLASYPSEKTDLSNKKVAVLSITASHDQVLKWDNYQAAKKRLPQSTQYISIEGGNHSGFGAYGHQNGDGRASISQAQQEKQIVQAISNFIDANENTSEN